jgi:hypothetical protein
MTNDWCIRNKYIRIFLTYLGKSTGTYIAWWLSTIYIRIFENQFILIPQTKAPCKKNSMPLLIYIVIRSPSDISAIGKTNRIYIMSKRLGNAIVGYIYNKSNHLMRNIFEHVLSIINQFGVCVSFILKEKSIDV